MGSLESRWTVVLSISKVAPATVHLHLTATPFLESRRASVCSVVRKQQTNRPFEGEFMWLQENYDLSVRQTPVVIG